MSVLLVEDDVGIGRFVARGLAAEGYAVTWRREAKGVCDCLAAGGFDAAILDIGLPDTDGLTLCRAVRAAGVATPIIMLTARNALQDTLEGFESGADDYLAKPFAFDELLARLAAVIRRGTRGAPVRCGTLVLDPLARTAHVGTQAMALSRREFDLAAALARRPGRAVARATLLADAWGPDAEVGDNALDVYIGYLRRHLAKIADAPHIATVRGVGFQLMPASTTKD